MAPGYTTGSFNNVVLSFLWTEHLTCAYSIVDIIHTVGPIGENRQKLEKCYKRCMEVAKENDVKSIVSISLIVQFKGPGTCCKLCAILRAIVLGWTHAATLHTTLNATLMAWLPSYVNKEIWFAKTIACDVAGGRDMQLLHEMLQM